MKPTAQNKKERKRTRDINLAYSDLRGCIPNVPSNTKLSKIKTLRLATSYIAYLMDILDSDNQANEGHGMFQKEICEKFKLSEENRQKEMVNIKTFNF